MILESITLLNTAHQETKAWYNHPCAKWARENINNYRWLCLLGLELCKEYTYRYGKTHACQERLEWLRDNEPHLQDLPMTDPPQAMAEECKGSDTVEAYREYYRKCKRHLAKWKNRPIPDWWE